jgi:hypothetical protein
MAGRAVLEYRQEDGPKSRYRHRHSFVSKSLQRRKEEVAVAKLLTHLASLEFRGIITHEDAREMLRNYYSLELRRQELASHEGKVVVVSNGELFFGEDLNEAMRRAKETQGERPVYSETVNMVDYPSPLG